MANVADDSHIFHGFHVLAGDDVFVASGSDKDICSLDRLIHGNDFIAVHGSLKCANRIDFRYHDARAAVSQRRGRAFAHVAIASDASDLAGQHYVSCTADRVNQRFLTAIKVIELRFGHTVIYIDRGERQLALLGNLVKPHDASCGFFRDTFDVVNALGEIAGLGCNKRLQRALKFDLFRVCRSRQFLTRFNASAPQCKHCRIAAVIQDHIRGQIRIAVCRPVKDTANIVPVIRQCLALDRKDWDAACSNGSCSVILC